MDMCVCVSGGGGEGGVHAVQSSDTELEELQ